MCKFPCVCLGKIFQHLNPSGSFLPGSIKFQYCWDASVLLVSGPMGTYALSWGLWVPCGVWVR